jgi:hypothetical protein
MSKTKIKAGDIFEIPLSNGQRAFGQYVFFDKKMGPLVQIFDLIRKEDVYIDELKHAQLLFPPIITGLMAAINTGLWRVVGHFPVERFVYPGFVSTFYDDKTGKIGIWYLWDGEKSIRIGRELPEEYKKLEFLCVWDPHDVAHRIETGENPYSKLIHANVLR